MQIDLLAAVELAASAAIAISVIAIGFGESGAARLRIAGWLFAWFVLVTAMAATRMLGYPNGLGAPGLGIAVVVPIVILVVRVLSSQALRRALNSMPLSTLIGVHTVRILGVFFLVLYAAGRLPAPFAPTAGWGDVVTGLAAAPLAWLLSRNYRLPNVFIWIWNVFGLLDLVTAIGLGAVSAPGPIQLIFARPGTMLMTTLPWLLIPAFLVPLLATIHLAVFYRLARHTPLAETGYGVASSLAATRS